MANGVVPNVNTDNSLVNSGNQIDFAGLIPQILEKFIAVLEAAGIILISFFLIRYLRNKLQKIESTHEDQRNAINLLEKITSGFIIVITITIALKVVGIDMTLLVSVAILGLSYGLQDIIKNYVAGILILFKSPFKIGDIIKIRDYTGKVSRMDFQATTLNTFDNRQITIYNSDVMTQSIVNFSNNSIRRLDFDVTLGYGSNIPRALEIFEKILTSSPLILKEPKFSISFRKFSDTGPMFNLKFWIQRPCNILKIRTAIATQISQAFDEENIFMPYLKGIEAEDETVLNKINDARKQRIQSFYAQPLFAESPPAATPEGQVPSTEIQPAIDSDEPE